MQRKSGNTSGMARHLEKHPHAVKAMLEKKSDTSAEQRKHTKNQSTWEDAFLGQKSFKSNSVQSKTITKVIAPIMAKDLQSYSIVEDAGVKQLMKLLEPPYQLPRRTTSSRTIIPKMYRKERAKIASTIQNDIDTGIFRI